MMMMCNCTLGGTQACKNCSRYKKYFGEAKELKGQHMFILTDIDLDYMLSEIALENRIAKVKRGEE